MKHLKIPETGKSPLVRPDTAPDTCSFCGIALDKTPFTAFTSTDFPHTAAICTLCLRKYNRMAKLMERIALYGYAVPDYLPLSLEMLSSMAALKGSPSTKSTVAGICLRALQRISAIFYGEVSTKCPKTSVSLLKPKPVVLVGPEPEACGLMFQAACDEAGLFYVEATPDEVTDGRAFEKLTEQANKETTWAEHGIIYCPAPKGYTKKPLALSTVVFGCRSAAGFPSSMERMPYT